MGLLVISAPVCLQLIPLQAPLKTMLQMSVVPLINSKNLDPHKFQKKIYKHPEAKCFCLCRLDKEGSAHPVGWWDGLCGGGSWVSQCEYVHRWSSFTIAGWTYTSVTHFCHPGGGNFFSAGLHCDRSKSSFQQRTAGNDAGQHQLHHHGLNVNENDHGLHLCMKETCQGFWTMKTRTHKYAHKQVKEEKLFVLTAFNSYFTFLHYCNNPPHLC